jgi:hypothetical protein
LYSYCPYYRLRYKEVENLVIQQANQGTEFRNLVNNALYLFDDIHKICGFVVPKKKNKISVKDHFASIMKYVQRAHIIVPLQSSLTPTLPPTGAGRTIVNESSSSTTSSSSSSMSDRTDYLEATKHYRAFPDDQVTTTRSLHLPLHSISLLCVLCC